MQKFIALLAAFGLMVIITGCGENAELPTIDENSVAPKLDFEAERQEAMEPFNTVEPYIVTNPDGTFSLNLPTDEDLELTQGQLEEIKKDIQAANDLIKSGELDIEVANLNLAPSISRWDGMNGIVSKHWWGFILALDQEATEQLIEDLLVWSLASRQASSDAAIVWPITVPITVYKVGLFGVRQAIKLAARRGNGIFVWITWTGQAFCILSQL